MKSFIILVAKNRTHRKNLCLPNKSKSGPDQCYQEHIEYSFSNLEKLDQYGQQVCYSLRMDQTLVHCIHSSRHLDMIHHHYRHPTHTRPSHGYL